MLSLGLKSDVSWYDLIIKYDEVLGNVEKHLVKYCKILLKRVDQSSRILLLRLVLIMKGV